MAQRVRRVRSLEVRAAEMRRKLDGIELKQKIEELRARVMTGRKRRGR